MPDFAEAIADGYATDGPAIELGRGVHDGELHRGAAVQIPLAMMNRHGLIAGATGTGKTRTLQLLAEQLSAAGVPVFAADVKGDLSGLSRARARPAGPAREAARRSSGIPFAPTGFPVEYLSLGGIGAGRAGARDGLGLRAAAARQGARRQRDAGAEPRRSSSTTPTRRACRCSTSSDLRALLTFLDSDEGKAS